MSRKEALQALLEKFEDSHPRISESVHLFKGIAPERAARLAAEAVTERIIKDLRALIAEADQ